MGRKEDINLLELRYMGGPRFLTSPADVGFLSKSDRLQQESREVSACCTPAGPVVTVLGRCWRSLGLALTTCAQALRATGEGRSTHQVISSVPPRSLSSPLLSSPLFPSFLSPFLLLHITTIRVPSCNIVASSNTSVLHLRVLIDCFARFC